MTKILFVDCDGTIRTPKSGAKFINDPHDQMLIDGVEKALEIASKRFDKIIGITNQAGIAAGHKSMNDAIKEQLITLQLAPQLNSILFCPDFEGLECWKCYRPQEVMQVAGLYEEIDLIQYRKPHPGMIEYGLIENKADRAECWMIGDRSEDEEAAQNAGINFLPADPWHQRHRPGIHEFKGLSMEQVRFLEPNLK